MMKTLTYAFCFMGAITGNLIGQGTTDPSYTAAYQAGIEFINKKDYGTAILQFQKAIKIQPQNLDASLRLVQCALVKQDLYAFQEGLNVLLTHNYQGLDDDFYLAYAQLAKQKKDYLVAIDAAQKGRAKNPNNLDLLLIEACIYKEQGYLLTAIQRLEQAGANYPSNPQIFNELADAYAQKGDRLKAIQNYQKTLTIEENNPWALTALGKLYLQQSQIDKSSADFSLQQASTYYQRYLTLNPQDEIAAEILRAINHLVAGR